MSPETGDPARKYELYYEHFTVGQAWRMPTHLVSADEVRDYAEKWDPLPIHIDARAAAASPHGSLIASGEQTFAIMRRALWDAGLLTHALRIVQQDELRIPAPVRVGDRLTTTATCTGKKAPSAAASGQVTLQLSVLNQDEVAVMTCIETLEVAAAPEATG